MELPMGVPKTTSALAAIQRCQFTIAVPAQGSRAASNFIQMTLTILNGNESQLYLSLEKTMKIETSSAAAHRALLSCQMEFASTMALWRTLI